MGIRFLCDTCGKKIHVKDFLAGKRGFCPKCGAGVDIPLESQLPRGRAKHAAPPESEPATALSQAALRLLPEGRIVGVSDVPKSDVLAESENAPWFMRAHAAAPALPLGGTELRQLLESGDAATTAEVRRDDWPDWVAARELRPRRHAVSARPSPAAGVGTEGGALVVAGDPATLLPPRSTAPDAGGDFSAPSTPLYYSGRTTVRRALLVATLLLMVLAVGAIGIWLIANGFRIAEVPESPLPRFVARQQVPDRIPRTEEMLRCDG